MACRIGCSGLAAALALILAAPAWGDTFKCIDANGRATYTNMKEETKGKNCTVVMREISVVPATPTPRKDASKDAASPAGGCYPLNSHQVGQYRGSSSPRVPLGTADASSAL